MSLRSCSEENAKGYRRREDEIARMIRQRLWGIHVEVDRESVVRVPGGILFNLRYGDVHSDAVSFRCEH